MTEVKPITPSEVANRKLVDLPPIVIECWNAQIAHDWDGRYAEILQEDIVNRMISKGIPREEIFDKHYLDIEEIYKLYGWYVSYDKPAYNEAYEPSFTFEKAKVVRA
jgi:hypothetical protein